MSPKIHVRGSGEAEAPAAEVVLRYTVDDDEAFTAEVAAWVADLGGTAAGPGEVPSPVRATLLRPVVGNQPAEWELRLTFPSFEALGRLVDDHGAMVPVLPRDTERRWASVEVDNPVLRHVRLPKPPTSDGPGGSDAPGT